MVTPSGEITDRPLAGAPFVVDGRRYAVAIGNPSPWLPHRSELQIVDLDYCAAQYGTFVQEVDE
jgi:hypothetical protein